MKIQMFLVIIMYGGCGTPAVGSFLFGGGENDTCTPLSEEEVKQTWIDSYLKGGDCEMNSPINIPPMITLADMRGDINPLLNCTPSCSEESTSTCVKCSPLKDEDDLGQKNMCSSGKSNVGVNRTRDTQPICPWFYINNIDKRRYPDSLREAQCCGDKCRTGDVRIECFCQPIIHHIVVLMRTENPDEQGKCVYKRKLHPLRVGCTPAKQYAPTGRG